MDAAGVQHRAASLEAKAVAMVQALRHLEEEFVAGRMSRALLAEKLSALCAAQSRLRAELSDGLALWVVLPRAVANNQTEPLYYGELLRTRPIPEVDALGAQGLQHVFEGHALASAPAADQLRELDAMLERSNSVLKRVQQESESFLRTTLVAAPVPPRVVADANADSLRLLSEAIQNGVGL